MESNPKIQLLNHCADVRRGVVWAELRYPDLAANRLARCHTKLYRVASRIMLRLVMHLVAGSLFLVTETVLGCHPPGDCRVRCDAAEQQPARRLATVVLHCADTTVSSH